MTASASARAIPPRVRRAALGVLGAWRARPDDLARSLGREHGFDTLGELEEVLRERFGQIEVAAFWEAFVAAPQVEVTRGPQRMTSQDNGARAYSTEAFAELTLLCIPDPWFAEALDIGHEVGCGYAFDLNRSEEADIDIRGRVDRLFSRNGVPYSFGDDERLTRRADPTLAAMAVQPALTLLDTPGVQEAKRRLLDAMAKTRAGRADDAIDAARKAVEEGLLALISAAENVEVPRRRQAKDEFDALVAGGVLPRYAEELVLSAPRFRGRTDAGHSGGPAVSIEDAEAVVGAAAASLIYLTHTLRAQRAAGSASG